MNPKPWIEYTGRCSTHKLLECLWSEIIHTENTDQYKTDKTQPFVTLTHRFPRNYNSGFRWRKLQPVTIQSASKSVLRIRSFLVTRIRIRIRENTGSGSGSFIHKKTPCYSNFLVIKLSKIQFRQNNFLSLILSSIIIFYLWF